MSSLNYKTGEIADSDKVIKIVIEKGMVSSVSNMPEGWQYYVHDLDYEAAWKTVLEGMKDE